LQVSRCHLELARPAGREVRLTALADVVNVESALLLAQAFVLVMR
jgi:hypothetical protein